MVVGIRVKDSGQKDSRYQWKRTVQEDGYGMVGDFVSRVYEVVAHIPPGRVTTYGRIARALGSPRSARMVGWALNGSPRELNLPAHRVVNRNGVLSGALHFGHPDMMANLLKAEGVTFVDEMTVDLDAFLWDPAEDPSLDHLVAVPDW